MTCTPLTDPLRHLLNLLAGTSGAPSDSLNRDGLEQARRFGWIYEYQGRVALTGPGRITPGMSVGGCWAGESGLSPLLIDQATGHGEGLGGEEAP